MKIKFRNSSKFALIDYKDYPLIRQFHWYYTDHKRREYAYTRDTNERITMHRLIMNAPKGMEVDHINGDGLNNRRSNLRICTRAENSRNRNMSINNKSGFYGVSYANTEKRQKRWLANISINGKNKYLGRYYTKEEAALVYNQAAKKYHGEFARLNIIDNS